MFKPKVQATIDAIESVPTAWETSALNQLTTKDFPGSGIGDYAPIGARIGAIQQDFFIQIKSKFLYILGHDHGIADSHFSNLPVAATNVRQVMNGHSAVNAITKSFSCRLKIVDAGVAGDITAFKKVLHKSVIERSPDFTSASSLSETQVWHAIAMGIELIEHDVRANVDMIGVSGLGLSAYPAAAVLLCQLLDIPLHETGLDQAPYANDLPGIIEIVQPVLDDSQSLDVLGLAARVGGADILGAAGICLAAACYQRPCVVDGIPALAGLAVAAALCPEVTRYCLAGSNHQLELADTARKRLALPLASAQSHAIEDGSGAALGMASADMAMAILARLPMREADGSQQR